MTATEIADLLHRAETPKNLLALHAVGALALAGDAQALQELVELEDKENGHARSSLGQVR